MPGEVSHESLRLRAGPGRRPGPVAERADHSRSAGESYRTTRTVGEAEPCGRHADGRRTVAGCHWSMWGDVEVARCRVACPTSRSESARSGGTTAGRALGTVPGEHRRCVCRPTDEHPRLHPRLAEPGTRRTPQLGVAALPPPTERRPRGDPHRQFCGAECSNVLMRSSCDLVRGYEADLGSDRPKGDQPPIRIRMDAHPERPAVPLPTW
jgi:hypothetical protein